MNETERKAFVDQITKDLWECNIPYKIITDLDRFYKAPDDLFELRFNNCNYVIISSNTIKLYFGISYKVYEIPEEMKDFNTDFSEAIKILADDINTELYWENPDAEKAKEN